MDRKLNNSLIALSAAGLFLAGALLVATPVDGGRPGTQLPEAPGAGAGDVADDDRGPRRGAAGARRGLALPYFSFAHGLRRIGG